MTSPVNPAYVLHAKNVAIHYGGVKALDGQNYCETRMQPLK